MMMVLATTYPYFSTEWAVIITVASIQFNKDKKDAKLQ